MKHLLLNVIFFFLLLLFTSRFLRPVRKRFCCCCRFRYPQNDECVVYRVIIFTSVVRPDDLSSGSFGKAINYPTTTGTTCRQRYVKYMLLNESVCSYVCTRARVAYRAIIYVYIRTVCFRRPIKQTQLRIDFDVRPEECIRTHTHTHTQPTGRRVLYIIICSS